MTSALALPKSPIQMHLGDFHRPFRSLRDGEVATYIPELAKVDPDYFGICLAAADGELYEVGDSRQPFTIQSISKAFAYGLALEDHGAEIVSRKVGVEPTGEAFNSILFDELNNRPYNPMVNAGAIATTALIKGRGHEVRFARIIGLMERFAGRPLDVDEAVYRSERATGHRNRAIAYLELNAGMIEEPIDEHLDLYFRQCSILVTARDLAIMAATLANNGVNPVTGVQAIAGEHVSAILSVMGSCGMYDFSGEWLYRVGLPAKSGVGGGIIATLPGQFGIGTFSPRLDPRGNSLRGIRVCEEFSDRFRLHMFEAHPTSESVVRRCYTRETVASKRIRRASEQALLERNGSAIRVYELQDDLYFATMEQLVRRIERDLPVFSLAVFDARRIRAATPVGLDLFDDALRWLAAHGKTIALAGFEACIESDLQGRGWGALPKFADLDLALEWCEERLLESLDAHSEPPEAPLSIAELDLFAQFSAEDCAHVAALVTETRYGGGDFIIQEHDRADRLFLLAAGEATLSAKAGEGEIRKRITTFVPGVSFGELALFYGGRRTADVIADGAVVGYELPYARIEQLAETSALLHTRLLLAIGRTLAERLRRTTAELRGLAA